MQITPTIPMTLRILNNVNGTYTTVNNIFPLLIVKFITDDNKPNNGIKSNFIKEN